MKAHLIEIGLHKEHSFSIKKIDQHHFESPFHFHDLCEMNYVVESFGKTIVGDNISNFSSGDLVLMSSNLPHIWYNDPSYFKEENLASAKAIVTYFNPDFLIGLTNDSQYNLQIKSLLEKAKRGIRFFGETRRNAINKLNDIVDKKGLEKVIHFLDIVNLFLDSKEYECLASIGYRHSFNEKDTERMNNVYQYLIKNFTDPISLSQIASVANLTPPAFCNFFKKRTQKSFSEFLNELRVGHACKLLQNQELTIADVCFQSGYQNMTNFNNFFKKITKKTPTQYRKECSVLL
ncbi:helix-turn-helix transcriptional regulator [Ginsengibacter hankyongi]|uniref:Helix-turn-helix transcriptional regulator n=1 Tax=Ginsengibacter hankyongi TaxID=2607284 RepID=A0A5J5IBG3_9BACT|nr:AraC family transcriptional regulator [Ginsengibacter hankyongi]KAA9036144.1 helix-turn-helix transcriptional regulator [Ginsengibacter hankyongi]